MGFFTSRERTDLKKVTEVEGEIREFVRKREFPTAEPPQVADRLANLVSRVAGQSIQEIDSVTADLRILREQLQDQSERIRREVVEYATLSQTTMESSKIIFENLAQWRSTIVKETDVSESPTLAPADNPEADVRNPDAGGSD